MSKRVTACAQPLRGQPSSSGRTPWGDIPRYQVKLGQWSNLWAALGHAERLGLRPNWTLDIHYERGGLADPYLCWSASLQRFLKLIRDWAAAHGERTAYLWSTEHVRGVGAIGVHTHLLIHVPPSLDKRFKELIRKWGRQSSLSMKSPSKVLNPQRIGKGNATLKAAAGKLRYISKDLEPAGLALLAPFKRLDGKPQISGEGASTQGVLGKKVGVSRNLDRAARKAWQPAPGQATTWLSADGRKREILAANDRSGNLASAA
jgi:hypothetical protein